VEIDEYLRVIRRRLWILILVPMLATAVVATVITLQPTKYRAVATVAATAVVGGSAENQYSGPNGVRVFVANFTAALTAAQVVSRVAQQTGASEKSLRTELSAEPIEESSIIEVAFVATDKAQAAGVVKAASSETIRFLFQSQVDLARKSVATADKAVAGIEKKLADFTKKTGYLDPQHTYELSEQNIISLRQRQLQEQAQGNTTAAATLGAAIERAEADLAKLAPQVADYRSLAEAKDQAVARRTDLVRSLQQLQAQSRAADPRLVVTVSEPEQLSRLSALIRQGGAAFAAGLFLAIGLVVLLELIRRPSGPRTDVGEIQPARLPVVGQLPFSNAVESRSSNVLADRTLALASEDLVANITRRLGGRAHGVLIVTSPPGRHGKTVVSTLLATLLGPAGNHVLLVGTRLDYPAVSSSGNGNGHGMVPSGRTFTENAPNSWVTSLWALERGLWVLPAWHDHKGGQLPPTRLSEILNQARDLFDLIIVDTPSSFDRHGLDSISWVADGILEVVSNADGAASMRKAVQMHLQDISAPFVGLVINRVRRRPALVDSTAQVPELPIRSDP
jgi:capsular polysaccharide biosynthesis protein/cellulose biosynthesis protein BcsQ